MKHNFFKAALKAYTVDGVPGSFLLRRLSVSEFKVVADQIKAEDPIKGLAMAISLAFLDAETVEPVFASPQEVSENISPAQLKIIGGDISKYSNGLPISSEEEADAAPGEAPPAS